jgi:membrane associated rhomboid family serine protease
VLPQALLALVARVDAERHVHVRVSQRPIWVNAAVGTVLAGAALVLLVREGPGSVAAWSAALGGVAGLLAAVPPVLVAPRRRRAPEPAARSGR